MQLLTQRRIDVIDRADHVEVLDGCQATQNALRLVVPQHRAIDVVHDEKDVQRRNRVHFLLDHFDDFVWIAAGRHFEDVNQNRVEDVFDSQAREESVDDDDMLVRQLFLVERLQQVPLRSKAVEDDRVALVEQRHPLPEIRFVLFIEILDGLLVLLAQRHARQQLDQLIVWQTRILQSVQRVVRSLCLGRSR